MIKKLIAAWNAYWKLPADEGRPFSKWMLDAKPWEF